MTGSIGGLLKTVMKFRVPLRSSQKGTAPWSQSVEDAAQTNSTRRIVRTVFHLVSEVKIKF